MTVTFTEQYAGKEDRSEWARGPWDNEPLDKAVWVHNGFDCMIKRNHYGAWCGYVGVKPGHKLFGTEYFNVYTGWESDIPGGLTYSAGCREEICHLADEGDHVWWFGFDCSHSFNLYPVMCTGGWEYTTQEEMIKHVNDMAENINSWEEDREEDSQDDD